MNLKKVIIGLSIVAISANAGFFDHDKEYYLKHQEEAQEKKTECNKAAAHAMIDKDTKKLKEIRNDSECKAAYEAIKDINRAKRAAKRAEQEKKEAQEKIRYEKEYKEQLALQKKMPYSEFSKINKECGFALGKVSAKCKAYQELRVKKKNEAMDKLISKYQGDELIAYRKKVCAKSFSSEECNLAMSAAAKDEKDTIAKLSSDKEAFKKVYNECAIKVRALEKKMKWNKANEVTSSFKCRTAMAAGRNFGIIGLGKPIK